MQSYQFRFVLISLMLVVVFFAEFSWAAPKARFGLCNQPFALCAASTGTLTGDFVKVKSINGATQIFPEVLVTCPVMQGYSIAGFNINQMGNSCKAPKGYVYSLFWPINEFPQEGDQWITNAPISQTCAPNPTTIVSPTYLNGGATQKVSQCWSIKCKVTDNTTPSGNKLAECSCAYGEAPLGGLINQSESSATDAGYGNPSGCNENPVSGAIPNSFSGN